MELVDAIKTMQSVLRKKIHYLNNGGCIHFAYYASTVLTELNIKHRVILANNYHAKVYNTYKNFDPVSHVFIYIKGIGYFDGYEFLNHIKSKYTSYRTTNLDLNRLRSEYKWCPLYKVQLYNPIVESAVNKYLNGN